MIIKKIFFSILPFLMIIIIIEISLFIFKPNVLKSDKVLGWELKKNVNYKLYQKNFFGKQYKVNFYTDKNGLRTFKTDPSKKDDIKFLVIGDSFSGDPNASNDKMWFSEIAKQIYKKYNKNTFVYSLGAGGYGSLQQLLAIKNLKKKKKFKDINFFILQFCNNDFLNNSITIERKLKNFNQSARRPYYVNGEIIYNSDLASKFLKIPIIGESRILNKIIFLFSKIKFDEKIILESDFQESLETTNYLLSEIKNELQEKPIFIFNCSENNDWPYSTLPEIANENKFYYLNFPININLSKDNFTIDKSHWSEIGNKNIGIELFKQINNSKIRSLFTK